MDFAKKLIAHGIKISFSGNITFKNAKNTEVAENISLDDFMLETDCPFLAPHPYRGSKNEPWKLVKSDKVQAGNILYHCAESLRLAAVMLSPVMPSKTKDILDILGTNDVELVWGKLKSGSKISTSEPIFPRIS